MRFITEKLGMASLISQVLLGVSPTAIDVSAPPSVPAYVLDYGEDSISYSTCIQFSPSSTRRKVPWLLSSRGTILKE